MLFLSGRIWYIAANASPVGAMGIPFRERPIQDTAPQHQ